MKIKLFNFFTDPDIIKEPVFRFDYTATEVNQHV